MTTYRQTINDLLTLHTTTTSEGRLSISIKQDRDGFLPIAHLTPEEVDKLVLAALDMTKPEHLDPSAEKDYQAAIDAVYVWQGTRAGRENARRRDAERDAVMGQAGYSSLTYANAGPAIQFLVDRLIEARKAGQK